MHTIVNLVENDCGIAFLYKTAANESLKKRLYTGVKTVGLFHETQF